MFSEIQQRYLKIYYLVTLLINIVPYAVLHLVLKNIAEAGPHPDPESDLVLIAMYEFIFMLAWTIWLIHFIRHASKKPVSWLAVYVLNFPYLYLLGSGQLSPAGIILLPLYLWYIRNIHNYLPFHDQILAAITLICWSVFMILLKKRRSLQNLKDS